MKTKAKNRLKIEMISKKHALEKPVYKPYHLYLNNQFIDAKVIKCKTHNELLYKLEGFNEINDKVIYLYSLNDTIYKNDLNIDVELICCNKNFQVVNIIFDHPKNKVVNFEININFLWITKKGFAEYYQIKIGDFLTTNPLYRLI